MLCKHIWDAQKLVDINKQKYSTIAILGAPNAGKSTLANKIVGTKFSIVSPKVQTTRVSLKGICIEGSAQLVFIDTPGIFRPNKGLEKQIVTEAWRGVEEADTLILLVDAKKGVCAKTEDIISALSNKGKNTILVINKIDTVRHEDLLKLAQKLNNTDIFTKTFMISAKNGSGVPDIKKYLTNIAPISPWLFPEDQLTEAPMRFLAAEITREKLFLKLNQELPYSLTVVTDSWKEAKGATTIHQTIYTNKESHKAIILGKNGSLIKQIGASARRELQEIIGGKVNLFLFIKIKKDWQDVSL